MSATYAPTLTTHAAEELAATWREAFEPAPAYSVSEWAEANIELAPAVTARPGPLDLDLTPYLREPLDAYGDPRVEEIVLAGCAQFGKSIFQTCCMGYTIAHAPAPMLFVMPNEPDAKSFSKQRLTPLFLTCEAIRKHIDSEDDLTLLEMKFRNCNLNIVGSNSPSRLSSRPVGRLFIDEVDKLGDASAKEASSLNLAMNRTRTFPRAKRVLTSTPTTDQGDIWREFKAGDQRYYYVPCPHCGTFDKLEFEHVKWPASCRDDDGGWNTAQVRASAVYVCPHCAGRITDADKPAMLRRGEWRATAKGLPRRRSYHLNGLYPIWATWGGLAVEFLSKKPPSEEFRDFLNSVLGLPFKVVVDSPNAEGVLKLRQPYPPGYCPEQPLEVIVTADWQASGRWYVVRAWGLGGRSWLLEEGFVETSEALAEVGEGEWRCPNGPIHATRLLVDSGDFTDEVYEFCKEYGWKPLKGDAQGQQTYAAHWGKTKGGNPLFVVKVNYCKEALFRKFNIPPDRPGAWMLHQETGRRYADHIAGEQIVVEPDGSRTFKRVGANHLLDCETYNLAAAINLRVRHRTHQPANESPAEAGDGFVRQPKHF
jgi:phage terminase large subunit GpA-like protein